MGVCFLDYMTLDNNLLLLVECRWQLEARAHDMQSTGCWKGGQLL